MANVSGVPFGSQVVTEKGIFAPDIADWLLELQTRVNANTEILKSVELTNQSASIGTTTIPTGSLAAGYYRVSYYMRKTTADGVNSSLTVTLGWTDGGIGCSQAFSALTTDTTGASQNGIITVRSDSAVGLTYGIVYASNTPGAMKFRFTAFVEALPTT